MKVNGQMLCEMGEKGSRVALCKRLMIRVTLTHVNKNFVMTQFQCLMTTTQSETMEFTKNRCLK